MKKIKITPGKVGIIILPIIICCVAFYTFDSASTEVPTEELLANEPETFTLPGIVMVAVLVLFLLIITPRPWRKKV